MPSTALLRSLFYILLMLESSPHPGSAACGRTSIYLPTDEPASSPAAQKAPSRLRVNARDGAEMVYIPEGDFVVGRGEFGRTITKHLKGFYIYTKPVTVAQFRRFCEATRRPMPPIAPWTKEETKSPMVYIKEEEARAYCAWAGVALLTDAQWEKAAWGDENPANSSSSPYGVQDLRSSVWQWCQSDPVAATSALRKAPQKQEALHLRGGTWPWSVKGYPVPFGATNRVLATGNDRDPSYGLRGAKTDP